VRGAAGTAQAYLQNHDRPGVVALAGMLRWLRPDVGERQFYRIVEQVLDVRGPESFVTPEVSRLPRTALPPWALVVLFSPLLDPRVLEVIQDLRERGYPLVVVDVLAVEPHPAAPSSVTPLALRLWRLDRLALRRELAELGVPVVTWEGSEPLDVPLWPLTRGVPARSARACWSCCTRWSPPSTRCGPAT